MIWLSWRLQRTETLLALGILVLLAALLVPTGLNMWDAYHHDGLGACLSANPSQTCFNEIGIFRARFGKMTSLAAWFALVPGLIGILFAAPLINDLEHGTYRLAWTQSVTRRRWLAGRLGLAIGGALLVAGALTLLFTWWHNPTAHLDGRLERELYDSSGTVVLGYTLFALGLALAVGAIWRRAAASLVVGFIGYFVARVVVDYKVRDHLVSPLRATWHGSRQPRSLFNADVMQMVGTLNGHRILGGGNFFGATAKLAAPNLRHVVFHAVYQPESHYWPLQLTETALFAGIGIILIAFAAWRALGSE